MHNEKYYYSVARARTLEVRLLTEAQLSRMVASNNFEAAYNVLSETAYAENLAKLKHPFDFEELCQLELASLKDLLIHLAPNNEILSALMNDSLLDQDYFKTLKQVCSNCPSLLIKNMVKQQIDLINIKMLLRLKDKDSLKKWLLTPGLIDHDILLNLAGKPISDISTRLNFTIYFPAIKDGLEQLDRTGSWAKLEKQMDDFVIAQFKTAKYLNSGLEPLVGFYLAKTREIKTIRFILISKKNYVTTNKIEERVRIAY